MNPITCPHCGKPVEIDKALEGQIEARVLAAERHKHETEIASVKKRAAEIANEQLRGKLELEAEKTKQTLELEREKMKLEMDGQARKRAQEQDHLIKSLREDAKAEKEANAELRTQLKELVESLREAKNARANAELEAQKKLSLEADKIREETFKNADEKYRMKAMEQEKKIADMQKSLDEAQRKAAQGSQQNQGEVLELDLENRLREEFPLDDITEVKKGQRGADIIQTVKNQNLAACGILLWETKNGKWQPAWVPKFKQDIREATANIGVIVSQEIPSEYGDMKHLEANVWVVKPKLAPVLAAALRGTILQVDVANRNNEGKDAKMEALYQFLVGPEFRHRVEAIVENYGTLQTEIEKEKRAAALRWAHQEKAIRAVIDNTIGMYGDLQGITSKALPAIRSLELDDEPEEPLKLL
jgi:hypothetical protein